MSKEETGVRIVIADPKLGKTRQIEVDDAKIRSLIGIKLGDTISGNPLGFPGYEFQITGGSDINGVPMRFDVHGGVRKKILVSKPPCYHPKRRGLRLRKRVRGNIITDEIAQINLKVVQWGKKAIFEEKERKKKEEKETKVLLPIKMD
ncbi:MAG: 30S ribosomal protein S6e [Promethearchaeota archaeon]